MRPRNPGGLAGATVLALGAVVVVAAQDTQERVDRAGRVPSTPKVVAATRHDVSRPLRDIAPRPPRPGRAPHAPLLIRQPKPKERQADPALQTTAPVVAAPNTIINFEGVNNVDGVLPPDTNGAIGPNHYVQWVNLTFGVYGRSGTLLYGPASGSTVWAGFGGPCETENDGDPIVLYDHLADRWLFSQFSLPNKFYGLLFAPFYQCIAISQTGDPTGAYYRYQYEFSKLNDYPKFGVWPDGYYMSINQFTPIYLRFAGQGVAVFNRAAMLAGQPANMIYFDLAGVDPNLGGMLPSDLDGPPPPAGSPNYFAQMDDNGAGAPADRIQLWRFTANWNAPSQSSFTGPTHLPVAAFDSNMCGYARACIPQPGGAKVDALADRLMYRLQYRNLGSHETLVVAHTVDVDGSDHAGVRWYEIRDPGGQPVIHQQGTYAPDEFHRWMPSAAMDAAGNMAIVYNVSGSTLSPSIRYAGRLASDPPGVMGQGENTLILGSGSQTHGAARWGDYSMLSVDPIDGCTFWATAEYMAVTGAAPWQTRIGAFRLPGCGNFGPPPDSPNGLTATVVSSGRIDLAWSDQSSDENGFSIERCTGTSEACAASGPFVSVGQTAAGETTYADAQLQASTTYSYRVRAFNGGGSSTPSNVATATTLAPPAVRVTATAPTATEAGPTNGVFTVSRDAGHESQLTVTYSVTGTAVTGTDYQKVAPSVTIPAGSASATVAIVPINDTTIEADETVVLTLTAGPGYALGTPSSATVTIVSDDRALDLVVTALTPPAVVAVGGTAQVSDVTKNQGTDAAGASTTSFYLSANYLLDATDVLIGSRSVPELAAGATSSASTPLTVPSSVSPGTYQLFAKADGPQEIAETYETNNTRNTTLRVGPDLAVATLSVPAIAAPGVPFTITDATKNQGAGPAAASVTRFYLSTNYLLDASDTPLQTRSVPPLDTGASSSGSTSVTIPEGTPTGGYFLIAKADDGEAVTEHTETNNVKYIFVNVGGDLMVTTVSAPLKVESGAAVAVTETTKNNGAAAVGPSTTAFYLSSNYALDASDIRLAQTRAVPSLNGGASSTMTTSVTLPAVAPGTWYLVAAADDEKVVVETSETNNARYTIIQVGPDLTMYSLTVPSSALAGSVISVTDTVRNSGGGTAGPSTVRFYLSQNTALDASDILLGAERAVAVLAPNATASGTTSITLPADVSGQYYIIAVADGAGDVAETFETNNTTARMITISR